MTGLAIAPLAHYSGTNDALSTPLLTVAASNENKTPEPNQSQPSMRKPLHSPGWTADLTHYQAQLIGAELAKSHGRHIATASPREAARAYGQARRRPQTISNLPRLRSVM